MVRFQHGPPNKTDSYDGIGDSEKIAVSVWSANGQRRRDLASPCGPSHFRARHRTMRSPSSGIGTTSTSHPPPFLGRFRSAWPIPEYLRSFLGDECPPFFALEHRIALNADAPPPRDPERQSPFHGVRAVAGGEPTVAEERIRSRIPWTVAECFRRPAESVLRLRCDPKD